MRVSTWNFANRNGISMIFKYQPFWGFKKVIKILQRVVNCMGESSKPMAEYLLEYF